MGVGVDVGEELLRVVALGGDHSGAEVVEALVIGWAAIAFREAVLFVEPAGDVEIEVHVDAVELELVDEIVEAFEVVGVDGQMVGLAAPDVMVVHVVCADAVDAQAGQARREALGLLVCREARVEA